MMGNLQESAFLDYGHLPAAVYSGHRESLRLARRLVVDPSYSGISGGHDVCMVP